MEALHSPALINVIYLIAASLFILGIKGLTHPRTAVRGNLIAGMGMLLAILVTLVDKAIVGYGTILAGMVVGGGLGAVGAIRVQMTQMPQFVALFNGFGGIASVLVAGAAFEEALGTGGGTVTAQFSVATAASGLIGAVTFWGSLVAYGKLEEKLKSDFLVFPSQKFINGGLFALSIVLGYLTVGHDSLGWYWVLCLVASVLGLTLVTPIGGADMPVVIALLNSYSGLAAASTGFILQNNVLIISGALVGASGIILTRIMCKAMNRSLTNVIFGAMAAGGEVASADEIYGGKVKATSPEEVAMLLETARRVAIVPGYGMAVAQAQHTVRELADILEARGTEVVFAIHPVAGRMPGHMNVLLAEAEVPYDKLLEMDVVNPTFDQTDVAIVIGANDVVNPLARTDPNSPIAGMPILNVDLAKTVVVVKRSLSPGFAGIPNPLFAAENCLMLFGDGKKVMVELNQALKEVS